MSTIITKFSFYFIVACAEFSLLFSSVAAQTEIEANIKIDANASPVIFVEGKFSRESGADENWSFVKSLAGAENLGERVSDLNLSGADGRKLAIRKLIAGEYLADGKAQVWSYKIDAEALSNQNAAAHISWLDGERGILMLGDLFPQFYATDEQKISAQVKFDVPRDWSIITTEKKIGENTFAVKDVDKAIFVVGKNWRTLEIAVEKAHLNLAISGDWLFSDDEARDIAAEIFAGYAKMFGEIPSGTIQISVARFPQNGKTGRWSAETRGANLTVLSSDMPFKTQSLQRLHEQLRHELFHLWIPNRLNLSGDYGWFYEGFAVYQALKTGVAVNRIRFEDYLDTLAQAFDFDEAQSPKISLVEQSKNRWSGANNQIYARGMLVAFLCDAALLRQSKGKRSVSDLIKEIYQKHRAPNESTDGGAAILEIFKRHDELNQTVEKYINGAEKIDWQIDLESIGVEQTRENSFSQLKVKAKLTGRQKDLLNELGYNSWRKLSKKHE